MKILPDWTKAPDWAIAHALYTGGTSILEVWVGDSQYQTAAHTNPYPYGGGTGETRHNPHRCQFHYETPRPAPWTGEGWPPVGTVCEFNDPDGDRPKEWFRGKVEYCSSVTAVVSHDAFRSGQTESIFYPNPKRFRPIRTPEQIAADERDKAIEDLYFTINWNEGRDTWPIISSGRKDGYAKAIDAGYHKQVTND